MDELDKGMKKLEIGGALLALSHIEYIKSKGKIGSSIWEALQEWETEALSGDKSEQSTLIVILFEAHVLEIIAKVFKQEAEKMSNREEKENGAVQS